MEEPNSQIPLISIKSTFNSNQVDRTLSTPEVNINQKKSIFIDQVLKTHLLMSAKSKNKKVYMLYISGSIGANRKLQIHKGSLKQHILSNTYLCDYKLTQQNPQSNMIISPVLQNGNRIQYCIEQMPHIDTSINMEFKDIIQVAKKIQQNYHQFDSFIILCGFDVICYISTLISFMLENLSKCIIFTGGYFPITYMRNDAINNIIDSFSILSAAKNLNDVLVVSKNKAYRANRSIKVRQDQADTIKSPNMHSIASVDIKIRFKYHLFLPQAQGQFSVWVNICQNVHTIKYHPYIQKKALKYDLQNPYIKGYVIQSYTAANLPQDNQILQMFKYASETHGKIFVNISQSIQKSKKSIMKQYLQKFGIFYGRDMTVQASLAKLSYLIGKGYSKIQIQELISTNMRGELTQIKNQNQFQVQAEGLMEKIQEVLEGYYPTSNKNNFCNLLCDQISKYITPNTTPEEFSLIFKDLKKEKSFPNFMSELIDRNNLIHQAVIHQNINILRHFLNFKVQKNKVDKKGCSAFFYALQNKNKAIIQTLYKNQCNVICPVDQLFDLLIKEVKLDKVQFFQLLYHIEFKTTLSEIQNDQKRTLAHIAAIMEAKKCLLLFQQKFKFRFSQKDIYGISVDEYLSKKKKISETRTNSV